jgi:hypothetical protein
MNEEILEKVENAEMYRKLYRYCEKEGNVKFWQLFSLVSGQVNKKYWKSKVIEYELKCPAIQSLTSKNNLNHQERIALLFIYTKLGEKGEQRLWEILKQQKNFKENICKQQIESYKKKGKRLGISCEKLIEWGICNDNFDDCKQYQKIKGVKDDKSI